MRCHTLIIGACMTMNSVLGAACAEGDEEDGLGAAVAEREGTEDDAVRAATASPDEAPVDGPSGLASPREEVFGPPGKCCYVRCGAQQRYHRIPWAVEGSCDAEGWQFCAQFYVTKLVDAAWLPC